jgi:hypothetical protein
MDVNPKVLSNIALYLQWRDTQEAANVAGDKLSAVLPHMTLSETQGYEHVVGLIEIAHRDNPLIPPRERVYAESVPMPALTPERLAEMDATRS